MPHDEVLVGQGFVHQGQEGCPHQNAQHGEPHPAQLNGRDDQAERRSRQHHPGGKAQHGVQ